MSYIWQPVLNEHDDDDIVSQYIRVQVVYSDGVSDS